MYGVIRFLDHPLFPLSAPDDYPKIIKSGIDEEGQHPKSPPITGPSGIVTLLYRIGHPQLLERILDVEKTKEFDLLIRTGSDFLNDLYVRRRGRVVEFGFISEGKYAQPGMRFRIETRPLDSPFQTIEGSWTPLSTSDLGSVWNGSEHWVRCQGAEFTKAIWFHNHFDRPDLSVSWSGMSAAENVALSAWMKKRCEAIDERESKVTAEYEERKTQFGDKFHPEEDRLARCTSYKRRNACRADCGEENPTFTCSKCKMTRYCSLACQSDDWKYHKTYCGTEPPIPAEF